MNNDGVRTASEKRSNADLWGSIAAPPNFCVRMADFEGWIFRWIFKVGIHFEKSGYSHLG